MVIDSEKITSIVEKIPAFPESVHRVIELTSSLDTPPKEIVAVIEHDPILTARLLKTVNSPYFGLAREVAGIKQAVVYVGMNTVKNVAITVATAGALPRTSKAGLDINALWMHSMRVGVIAKLVAKRVGVGANDLAGYFVAGLLHDIGKIVFGEYLVEDYKKVMAAAEADPSQSFRAHEQAVMGIDHAELGALVAEKWKLPADLIQAIREHHRLVEDTEAVADAGPTTLGVCFGNLAAHYLEAQLSAEAEQGAAPAAETSDGASLENLTVLPAPVLNWVGGAMVDILAGIKGLTAEIEKAQTFMASGG
jgi:putative nucleotidyltransferase with HDIG domain